MKSILPKRSTFSFFAVLALFGLLLAGCCQRSVLGRSDFLTFLAAGKITSPINVEVYGQLGALGSIDPTVSGYTANADLTATQDALLDLAASKLRLQTLPVVEKSAADLTAGPLTPGFYHLTGNVTIPDGSTIDVSGNGVYVFNIDGNLNIGNSVTIKPAFAMSDSSFTFGAANVFWNVGGSTSIGAAGELAGNFLSTGNLGVGPNVTLYGKLFSLTGNVAVQGGEFLDGSGLLCPYLSVPQEVTAVAGQPLQLKLTAGLNSLLGGTAPLAISVKGLPAGAVQYPNCGGVDAAGPNGSDLLAIGLDNAESTADDFCSKLSWTPLVPGVYKILYFAQTEALPLDGGGGSSAPAILGGTIDLSVVTIRVVEPVSTVGNVTGSGTYTQGANTGTFSVGVLARKAGQNTALGTFTFADRAQGITGQSESVRAVVVSTPAPGQKIGTVYGTARVNGFGAVPYIAQFFDGGRTAAVDQVAVTLYVDVNHDGTPDPVSLGGGVARTKGSITVE